MPTSAGTPTPAGMLTPAEAVRAWVAGWSVSRDAPAPVEVPGGFRIDVGLPGHVRRYVLPEADPAVLRDLMAAVTEPGTWIKVCAPAGRVTPSLTPRWEVRDPEFMMSTTLRPADVTAPDGYAVRTVTEGGVTGAEVIAPDGSVAASGRTGRTGAVAVFDRIATDAAHRRRGLGSLVMRALSAAALERGAEHGVLVATRDGLALYGALGWDLRATVTPCVLDPEDGASTGV
ncbi:GNAT family N-acetyltransferase [Streptomyces griseocarneus]|nr:GNAT family N-acetyltransferase [Streptomyces griseocarneus]